MRHLGCELPLLSRPLGRSATRTVLERVQSTVAGVGAHVSPIERSDGQRRHRIFRILLSPDRLPHFQIDLPASNSGRADGVGRFGLADLSVITFRKLSIALHSDSRPRRTRIAGPAAFLSGTQGNKMIIGAIDESQRKAARVAGLTYLVTFE